MEEENIIIKIKPHRLHYFLYYLSAFLILVLTLLIENQIFFRDIFIFLIIILFAEIFRWAETYYFYKDKIVYKFKLIVLNEKTIYYEKIQDFTLKQNILDVIFNLGNFYVNTAGSPEIEIVLKGIKNPKDIQEEVKKLIANFKK